MSILSDLFDQIIQSEEKIRERFSKLREVNKEIHNCQSKSQDLLDEFKSLEGLLIVKNQSLSEEELKLRWFKIWEDVLVQKRAELLTRKALLFKQKEETKETIASHRRRFAKDAVDFMTNFDFYGRGKRKRISSAPKQSFQISNSPQLTSAKP
ncbi:coiled-coil domain-containing protein 172-like [Montipora capricornis]|uniref:coiled-coil domain-containing protein 172-like n=1 Tax=Montipora capricornis TaxID=246305 RepID=UPI0035F1899A